MPTGYTANIRDGIDFKTFAMNCARAFGACVMLRDEPGGGERIPERFEPSNYHLHAAECDRERLANIKAMSPEELERAAGKDWDDAVTSRQQYIESKRADRAAYEAMLAHVEAWTPPTADHQELKEFMRKQIVESLAFDCREYPQEPVVRLAGQEWREREIDRLTTSIAYHAKHYAQDVERANQSTAWIQALRASL